MDTFTDTGLQEELLDAIRELGFEKPTPIQAKTIPQLLSSRQDIIASAQTGTGKTAAFGLPTIQLTDIADKHTQTLILSPTRELCLQISKDLTQYSKYRKGMNIVAVYGGSSIDLQVRELNRGAHIVVATPGRAVDLIHRKKLLLGKVKHLVLDEADEMLSMGFKDDLDVILAETPSEKQTMLFSATMSKEILAITKKYMNDPIKLSVAQVNTGAENVKHLYYMVHSKDRYEVLKRIADIHPDVYGIVFCRTRRETKEVANKLIQDGYNADALHGDLSQAQRDEVMGKFRNRQLQLLVATDVAARGLDVNDLTHIINFNLPDNAEIYTHRSGRTGRAGKSGTSIAIIHTREISKIKEIQKRSGIVFSKGVVPTGKEICTKQLYSLIDRIEKVQVDEKQIEPFLPAIYEKLAWLSREELIKHFVSAEFNRFLDYYKNARDINVEDRQSGKRERGDRGDRGERGERGERGDRGEQRDKRERGNNSFTRLYINVGSKDNLNPGRLIGLVNEGLDSGDAEIGKIEIMRNFTFFEIEEPKKDQLIEALKGTDYEGIELTVEVSQEKSDKTWPAKKKFSKSQFSKSEGFGNKKYGKKNDRKRNDDKGRRKRRDA